MKINRLVYWTLSFLKTVEKWIQTEHPLFLQEWELLLKEDMAALFQLRPSLGRVGRPKQDRAGEFETVFHSQALIPWIPFEEYPRESFSDCMFESAQLLADKGKTIDILWSGGLDSTAALLAFNELGLHKQLHVIMGGIPESPEIFEEVVKGRMDYTWDETITAEIFYGIARPDEHVLCSCSAFDGMFGQTGGRGVKVKFLDNWKIKRRYYSGKDWCSAINFSGDWVDIDNYMPFVMQPPLEKWLCNHVIDGNMVYYDITDESWGFGEWLRTGEGYAPNAPGQEHYKKCKMPVRDFLYMITKDEYLSYHKPKVASGCRLAGHAPGSEGVRRILAITNDGVIVTSDNFYDFDWASYIVNF